MNELPTMPIRAKYADKLSEGSPDRIKLDSLPVSLNVSDIKSLTTAQCNQLKAGDIVTKEDSTGKHTYVVTFKKDGTGMCLSYFDGSGYIETVSYDLVDSEWVYNSTDVFNAEDYATKADITGGTLENAKPIYWHSLTLKRINDQNVLVYYFDFIIINNDPTPFTLSSFTNFISNLSNAEFKIVQGYLADKPSDLVSYFKFAYTGNIDVYSVNLTDGTINVTIKRITEASGVVLTDNGVNKLN